MKIYTRHTMKQPTNKLPYKRVKIIWVDICSSSQWYDDLKDVDDFTYSFCEDIGYLYSKDSKVVKIFTSFTYDNNKLSVGKADVITGGFPCQPFSGAGKRKGTDDDRYLWDETIRVIRECKPRWFIGENVEGIINIQEGMVLKQVCADLENEGFEVQCHSCLLQTQWIT
jgi:hypothetical protein